MRKNKAKQYYKKSSETANFRGLFLIAVAIMQKTWYNELSEHLQNGGCVIYGKISECRK
jgi:hypothetical protein